MPNVNELESLISALGWTLKSVKSPTTASNGRFVATIEPPEGGQPVTRDGDTPERALANALMFAQRRNAIRTFANLGIKVAKWDTPWREQLDDIAQAYGKMPVYDEKAVPAWQALANESKMQADAIRNQIKVNVTDDPEPYPHHAAMIHDIHHNGTYNVSRAHADHPIWSIPDHVNFRIAHEVLGHGQTGGDYGWEGENTAVGAHMPMLSPLARRALFTETLGQTAAAMRKGSHSYGPKKVGLMEDFLGPVEKMNGEHVYVPHGKLAYPENIMAADAAPSPGWEQHPETGIWQRSPSQGQVAASVHTATGEAWLPQHTMDSLGGGMPRPIYDSLEPDEYSPNILPGTPVDPNQYYQTPQEYVQPYMAKTGGPEDYLNRGGVEENVGKFDENGTDPFITLSPEEQRKTIRNAFATVILSPKKSLTWNAAHYQAIKDLDSSSKPEDYFDSVMKERNYHNSYRAEGKGVDPFDMEGLAQVGMNRARYESTVKKLRNYITRSSGMSDADAWKQSKKTIMQMYTEVEPYAMMALEKENEMRAPERNLRELEPNGMRLRIKTWEMTNAWLDSVLSGYKIPQGKQQGELVPPDELGGGLPLQMASAMRGWLVKTAGDLHGDLEDDGPNETTSVDITGRYGGLMYDHLEAISRLNQDVLETMRQYAVKDVSEDHGKGFIFRTGCVAMNIPGIGPKTASFAWLLIHPQTSELGIIDTHALRGLGFEEDALKNDRNYYVFERMQRAAKDASGYADMPLGKYHWGMWDMLRTPGTVSDHRLLRPRDPLPWDDPDVYHGAEHIVSRAGQPLYVGSPEFEATRPVMEQVKRNAQIELGMHTKKGVRPLPIKATHYAQGLLPNQPPDAFREPATWRIKKRYTVPSWIDPKTNLPYPEALQGYETPAMRAASSGWATLGGWKESDDMSHIDFAKYVDEANGDSRAARQRLYDELVAQGMDQLTAWSAANEQQRNWESWNPTHHQLETYPERYQPGAQPRTFGETPEFTDMSEFEHQMQEPTAEPQHTDFENDAGQTHCPSCQGQVTGNDLIADEDGVGIYECKHCKTQLHETDPGNLDSLEVSPGQEGKGMPSFPEPTGETAPGNPGFRSPEEEQYYRDGRPMPPQPKRGSIPLDPETGHGGYANTLDVICSNCGRRHAREDKCPSCGKVVDETDTPPMAGMRGPNLEAIPGERQFAAAKQSTEEQIKLLAQKLGLGDTDYGDIWYDKSKGEVIFNSGDGGSIVDDYAGEDGNSDESANQRAESRLLTLFGTIPGVKKFTIEYEIAQPEGTEGVPYKQFTKGGSVGWIEV